MGLIPLKKKYVQFLIGRNSLMQNIRLYLERSLALCVKWYLCCDFISNKSKVKISASFLFMNRTVQYIRLTFSFDDFEIVSSYSLFHYKLTTTTKKVVCKMLALLDHCETNPMEMKALNFDLVNVIQREGRNRKVWKKTVFFFLTIFGLE